MPISQEFQERLNELINENEIKSIYDLVKAMHIDYRSLYNAKKYGIIPTPKILCKIADYFNIPINYLLGYSDNDYFEKSKSPQDFPNRLKSLCKENCYSFYKVEQDCHIDKGYVSRWIREHFTPNLVMLELLCDYFNISLDYILGRTDYKHKS